MKTFQFLSIIIIMTLLLASCSKKKAENKKSEQIIAVQVAAVKETATVLTIYGSGVLASKTISKLSFKTGGIINHLYVDEGSVVKKGQLLASLNLTEITAQVQQARVSFEKAKRVYNRTKNLYADTVVTLEQFENATSLYEAALETKTIAEFNQQYSQIVAPANGIIISKLAQENELAGPGTPVLVFSEQGNNEWVVRVGVSDKDAVTLKKGDKAKIAFDAFQGKEFEGEITRLSELADPTSGTFEVEVSVKPGNIKFINGLVASAIINSSNKRTVSLLPPDAVTESNGHKGYVYVVPSHKTIAKKVPVTISHVENSSIAVLEPLNDLGMVVTKGAAYLEDGSKISIK